MAAVLLLWTVVQFHAAQGLPIALRPIFASQERVKFLNKNFNSIFSRFSDTNQSYCCSTVANPIQVCPVGSQAFLMNGEPRNCPIGSSSACPAGYSCESLSAGTSGYCCTQQTTGTKTQISKRIKSVLGWIIFLLKFSFKQKLS